MEDSVIILYGLVLELPRLIKSYKFTLKIAWECTRKEKYNKTYYFLRLFRRFVRLVYSRPGMANG